MGLAKLNAVHLRETVSLTEPFILLEIVRQAPQEIILKKDNFCGPVEVILLLFGRIILPVVLLVFIYLKSLLCFLYAID